MVENMAKSAHDSRLGDLAPHYSVIIVGGGINGCGTFRDLCAQGVDCLLIERSDFCSGASAAPSRLIHGGIKYLETGEFRLVRQSARERNLLLRNAPHYVKPLATVLPVYSWFGGIIPSVKRFLGLKTSMNDRGAVITEVGLFLYDLFGRHARTMPNHKLLLKRSALSAMPNLNRQIVAAGIYYEGRITHAERLGLELLLDGIADNPASKALNYVSATAATDRTGGIDVVDASTGQSAFVTADVIVNAGGAWIDSVNQSLGISTQLMGGNKGSHLIVRNSRLFAALDGKMVYFGSADGRVNLLYPFMGNVLVGSTDIPVRHPDEAECSSEERDYLANITREVFPDIEIEPDQIVMTYCGVRPLPRSEGIDPGLVSRDHSIARNTLPGSHIPVYALIGGKWTTFRGFSEEAADIVLHDLRRARRLSTETLQIGGGREFPTDDAAMEQFIATMVHDDIRPRPTVERLVARYGTRARSFIETLGANADTPLTSLEEFGTEELKWICQREMVEHLADVLFRRTDIALSGRMSFALIEEAAEILAQSLDWSMERRGREIDETRRICQTHDIPLG